MEFSTKSIDARNALPQAKTGCIVVGIYENKKLSSAASSLDNKGAIMAALKSGDITGKPGTTLLLRCLPGIAAERVLLVGLGKEQDTSAKEFLTAAQAVARVLATLGSSDAQVALPFDRVAQRDSAWALRSMVLAAREQAYRYDDTKSQKDPAHDGVRKEVFLLAVTMAAQAKTAVTQAVAIANGIDLEKYLGNLPANICTPTF